MTTLVIPFFDEIVKHKPRMAALGVLLLIGCHKDSCSPRFNPIPLNPTPTNDVVNNVLDNSALVIGANSSAECVALQRRLINITTGGLGDPNLHTLVIGAAQCSGPRGKYLGAQSRCRFQGPF